MSGSLLPQKGQLRLDSVLPATPHIPDALSLVTKLRLQYDAKGYPGRFTVKLVRSILTMEPIKARRADCVWTTVTPVMKTRISIPAGVRNASHALSAILQRVADNVGVKIGTASIPVLAFVSGKNITLSANDEPANAVLAKLFEQLSPGPVPDSWHLFYEPG